MQRILSCVRRRSGQSLIEFAIAAPILLYLFLGAFSVGVMISDKVIAGYAVRQGARLASELGGIETNPSGTTAGIDGQVVRNVLVVAQAMNYSVLTKVIVYQPVLNANGDYDPSDPANIYNPAGTLTGTTGGGFSINNREQIPPSETSIGVKLFWSYSPPTGGLSFNVNLTEYAVMKASPVLV
jgi:Flp pilus assembly protein TadG